MGRIAQVAQREEGGSSNMIIFISIVLSLLLGLGALYLYINGAFTTTSRSWKD